MAKKTKSPPPKAAKAKPKKPKPSQAVKPTTTGGAPVLHALVIGCDCYLPNDTPEGTYPTLGGCVEDARKMEQFLRSRAGVSDDRLVMLTSTAKSPGKPKEPAAQLPTYANIVQGIKKITAAAKKGDHVFVHYSGHGGRCPTIVPKVKGADGLDESLVPIDIGDSSARYVRDVEMAKLLRDMAGKGLVVTLVLDCCHSGGATRAVVRPDNRVGIRGVEFIDRTVRPTDSLAGTHAELEAAAAGSGAPSSRAAGAARGMAGSAQAGGAVVLAACRPSELAREFPFDGKQAQGALTYWFLQTAGQAPPNVTFGAAYDTITLRIHGQFPDQTPMLFGDADRAILAGVAAPLPASIRIAKVSGNTLTLGSGQVGLIRVDAEFAVYPAAAPDLSDASARSAIARVTAVRATDATAEVTQTFGGRNIAPGDQAVPLGVPQKLMRTVRVAPAEGAPASASQALAKAQAALKGQTWVEPVGGGDAADFVVTTSKDGKQYEICDAGGVPIKIRPALDTGADESARKIVARLVHLARFQAVRTLDNGDPFSPLRGKLRVDLLQTPPGFQEGDELKKLKPFPAGKTPRVKNGAWLALAITNQSAQELNVVVLDLASNWQIAIAHPDEAFHPIEAKQQWLLPLQASVPAGQGSGKDVLKVIATVDPPPRFQNLELPPLDEPIPPAAQRGHPQRGRGAGPASPLDALLDAVAADRPTRAVTTGSQPTRGWTIAHVEIEIDDV